MGRVLALDVGERRIGVAISDPDCRLAVPLRVVECRGGTADAQAIIELAKAEAADAIVVGHPLTLAGARGPQAREAEEFANRLAKASGLPIELWDERLTSVQAERGRAPKRARSKGKRRRRAPADDLAAALILQSYLDRRRASTATP